MTRTLALALAGLLLASCQTPPRRVDASLAPLQHVVLFTLHDPADAPELMRDSLALLEIPGVTTIVTGPHVDVGRSTVISDYHVGLVVGLQSVAHYRGYLEHPIHDDLIARWRPKFAAVRVIDFGVPADAASP